MKWFNGEKMKFYRIMNSNDIGVRRFFFVKKICLFIGVSFYLDISIWFYLLMVVVIIVMVEK